MTTFISYSRVNSDFALQLAKDLRRAGFDIWFDQLDIPTGSRWDDEIEKALASCSTFLIILSPASIQSQNVKDEIGYAIDSGKNILPVVLENCQVPFRLRRFQYVDFSGQSAEKSMEQIQHLLGRREKAGAAPKDTTEVFKRNVSSASAPRPKAGAPAPGRELLVGVALFGVVAFALAVFFAVKYFGSNLGKTEPTAVVPTPTSEAIAPTDAPTSAPTASDPTPTLPPGTAYPADFTDSSGAVMRLVAAGEFIMGSLSGDPDEKPVHTVYLDAYYIDAYEVTNGAYQACVETGICASVKGKDAFDPSNPQFAEYPVVNVDWTMAKTFCEWRGKRLPTEAEWEKAARGPNGLTFPWGEGLDCGHANYLACGSYPKPVGSLPAGVSPYGVFDMIGNVWEWVADFYGDYSGEYAINPTGPARGDLYVIRGGSWGYDESFARSTIRFGFAVTEQELDLGFRCALTP